MTDEPVQKPPYKSTHSIIHDARNEISDSLRRLEDELHRRDPADKAKIQEYERRITGLDYENRILRMKVGAVTPGDIDAHRLKGLLEGIEHETATYREALRVSKSASPVALLNHLKEKGYADRRELARAFYGKYTKDENVALMALDIALNGLPEKVYYGLNLQSEKPKSEKKQKVTPRKIPGETLPAEGTIARDIIEWDKANPSGRVEDCARDVYLNKDRAKDMIEADRKARGFINVLKYGKGFDLKIDTSRLKNAEREAIMQKTKPTIPAPMQVVPGAQSVAPPVSEIIQKPDTSQDRNKVILDHVSMLKFHGRMQKTAMNASANLNGEGGDAVIDGLAIVVATARKHGEKVDVGVLAKINKSDAYKISQRAKEIQHLV